MPARGEEEDRGKRVTCVASAEFQVIARGAHKTLLMRRSAARPAAGRCVPNVASLLAGPLTWHQQCHLDSPITSALICNSACSSTVPHGGAEPTCILLLPHYSTHHSMPSAAPAATHCASAALSFSESIFRLTYVNAH